MCFDLAIDKQHERYEYISKLNKYLRDEFNKLDYIHINSPKSAMPNTLNISLINKDTKHILEEFGNNEIYLSTTTACSLGNSPSKSVLAITGDEKLASNTLRISLSHLTTMDELEKFLEVLKKACN